MLCTLGSDIYGQNGEKKATVRKRNKRSKGHLSVWSERG